MQKHEKKKIFYNSKINKENFNKKRNYIDFLNYRSYLFIKKPKIDLFFMFYYLTFIFYLSFFLQKIKSYLESNTGVEYFIDSSFLNKIVFLQLIKFWKFKKNFSNLQIIQNIFKKENKWEFSNNLEFQQEFIMNFFLKKKKIFLKFRRSYLKQLHPKILKKLILLLNSCRNNNKKIIKYLYSLSDWKVKKRIEKRLLGSLKKNTIVTFSILFDHWNKFKKFKIFSFLKLPKKVINIRKNNFLIFLNYYKRNFRKKFKLLSYYRSKKYLFFKRKFKKKQKLLSLNFKHYIPRNYRNPSIILDIFPKRLQKIFAPYDVFLKLDYLNIFKLLKKNYFLTQSPLLIEKNSFVFYYLKFKKKRNNFYFTVFNNMGSVIYSISSGKYAKHNFPKRNKKLRSSLFSLNFIIKNICKTLKKKKIFKINIFIKPFGLKFYIIRRMVYSFFRGGIKILYLKNFLNFSHGYLKRIKKIRRL